MNKKYLDLDRVRSSHRRCFVRKGIFRNFTKFTGKHLRQSLFFNKVVGTRPATLLKKRLWHRCFPVNFAKFLITPFLQNTSGRLLLILDQKSFLSSWDCLSFLYETGSLTLEQGRQRQGEGKKTRWTKKI